MQTFTPYPIALGPITTEDISITVSESNLILSDEIEQRINEIWEQKEIEAKDYGLNFFNGTSYRINSWEFTNTKLQLDLAVFDFKHRLGLVTMSRNKEIDSTQIIQGGCFVAASVQTNDDKYLMVKQSGKSALNQNNYDVLGGIAETDVPCIDGTYFHEVLYQELHEEGNIERSDVTDCTLAMMFAGINGHYGFYFNVTVNVSADELIARHQQNTDIDIDSLHAYSYNTYLTKLKNHSSQNKHLFANYFKMRFAASK